MKKQIKNHEESPIDTIEMKLNQTQLLLNALLESPKDIVIRCIDTNYRYLLFNEAYKNSIKTAYGLDIAIGKNVLDCINVVEDKNKTKLNFDTALSGKAHATIDTYGNSTSSYFENFFYPIFDEHGCVIGATAFSQNITERKRTEFHLLESEAKFRNLFTESPVGKIMVGLDYKFIHCNKSFCKFIGYPENELIGKTIPDVTYPDDIKLGMNELKQLIEENLVPPAIQKRYVRKDGEVVWGEIAINLVRDTSGKPLYFLPVIQDISFRKIAETERDKLKDQLNQMQKLESLGILAGGIAHDFNNLMGGIFGYVDLAFQCSNDPLISEYLDKAMSTLGRAKGLTQQLLTFAKGGSPIRKISHLFPFVQESAQFALSGTNVSCVFHVPAELWACKFDKTQIGQVIDNIIINDQQAMPLGGTIELTANNITLSNKQHPSLVAGKYVVIAIMDCGVGIPNELLTRIFDPFFTTKTKGHGLGLATCYSIVTRHDGAIDVKSVQGQGCTFKIYLPAESGSSSFSSSSNKPVRHGSGTIIVMDDEEIMRETIGQMLKILGYTAICKNNGNDTLTLFKSETTAMRNITAMILDLTIPGSLGGKETISEIRKLNADIPVIVASGYADDPVMQHPVYYGFTASISKPFKITDLAEILSAHLKQSK